MCCMGLWYDGFPARSPSLLLVGTQSTLCAAGSGAAPLHPQRLSPCIRPLACRCGCTCSCVRTMLARICTYCHCCSPTAWTRSFCLAVVLAASAQQWCSNSGVGSIKGATGYLCVARAAANGNLSRYLDCWATLRCFVLLPNYRLCAHERT